MTPIEVKIAAAVQLINDAIYDYKPIRVFGLFSGGHDSTSSTFIASQANDFSAAVHINTGIGIKATRDFVEATCKRQDWPLIELKAAENENAKGQPDPQNYRDFVLKHGFPGPAGHGMMYVRLKERALRRLARMFHASGRGLVKRRILLIAGCRSQESARRMGNTEIIQVDGRFIWVNPIHDWSRQDTSDLIEHAGLERNPIVDLIHKSGECLCGAFAKPGELEELNKYPETREAYERIKSLEVEAKAAGKHCVWGTRPPRAEKAGGKLGPLCWGCTKQETEAQRQLRIATQH